MIRYTQIHIDEPVKYSSTGRLHVVVAKDTDAESRRWLNDNHAGVEAWIYDNPTLGCRVIAWYEVTE